jgi:drug/metabolite transporter (DMT)-like permease
MGYAALLMLMITIVSGQNPFPPMQMGFVLPLLYLSLFGSVIAFTTYFSLVGRIGAVNAAYATLLFPLVALTVSTFYEGFQWSGSTVGGVIFILLGNCYLFAKPKLGLRPGLKHKNQT